MDHRWYQMQDNQLDVSLEDAARHFYDEYAENPVKRLVHRISSFFGFRRRKGD